MTRRHSPAEKERAVRAVRQLRKELGTDHGMIQRVAEQLDIGVESLRTWGCARLMSMPARSPGTTTAEAARIRDLEQELKELRRANAILRSVRFTDRLDEIGARPSIRTVADSFDTAWPRRPTGSTRPSASTGPDAPRPWDDVDELELATLSWVHWFTEHRLHSHGG